MNERCEKLTSELASGDPDRVNDAIDDIKSMDIDGRIELYECCFDELTALYASSDDGYVRQSVVRAAERLVPGLATAFAVSEDGRSVAASVEEIRAQTDALCGFLLEAIVDEDGRVRQSAQRGLKDVFRTYDALEDRETIEALVAELAALSDEHSEAREKHLRESKADAEFFLQSGFGRILDGFQKEFGDRL